MGLVRRARSRETGIAALCIVFLAWFSMKFYMDNSNDSETMSYVTRLLGSLQGSGSGAAVDGAGNYTRLAPLSVWPFATLLRPVSGIFEIRAFVIAHFLLSLVLFGAAYTWYRRLGLGWLVSLLGLVLLSISAAFALLVRGWELDKLIEPALFLLAALAAWERQYLVFLGIGVLAVVNRESGALVPLVALAALARDGGILAGLRRWPFWASVAIAFVGVLVLRALSTPPMLGIDDVLAVNLRPERLVYVLGGFCLLPLLSTVWIGSAPMALQRLFFFLAPAWLVLALAADHLEQGALLLTPQALLFVPLALLAIQAARRPATRSG